MKRQASRCFVKELLGQLWSHPRIVLGHTTSYSLASTCKIKVTGIGEVISRSQKVYTCVGNPDGHGGKGRVAALMLASNSYQSFPIKIKIDYCSCPPPTCVSESDCSGSLLKRQSFTRCSSSSVRRQMCRQPSEE